MCFVVYAGIVYLMRYFITRKDNNKTLLCDDAPEGMIDYVRQAHDGEPPNDWRWRVCGAVWDSLVEGFDTDETVDSLIDIYYTDLFQWLADDISRRSYCDEAIQEGLVSIGEMEIAKIVSAGQYVALQHVVQAMTEAYDEFVVSEMV